MNKITSSGLFYTFWLISFGNINSCHQESAALDKNDLRVYIEDLASDHYQGRESGSIDSRRTAYYIADRYKSAGLYPAFETRPDKLNIKKVDNEDSVTKSKFHKIKYKEIDKNQDPVLSKSHLKSFIQPFGFKAGLFLSKNNYLHLTTKSRKEQKISITPLPFSNPGIVSGNLYFGGFCLRDKKNGWDDFKNLDPENKILLCLRHGPGGAKNSIYGSKISFQSKWKTLSKAGAVGAIFLGRDGFKLPAANNFAVSMKPGTIGVLSDHSVFFDHFPFLKKEYNKLLKKKKSDLIGQVLGKVLLKTRFKPKNRLGYNVGVYLKKPKPGQRLLVLGAHLDHLGYGYFSSMGTPGKIHKGADDNASGTATVLEIALHLIGQKARIPENSNVLFLHFDAEERGLIGSRHFLNSGYYIKPEVMINLDMIGRLRKSRGMSFQGCQTADDRWQKIVSHAFAKYLGGGSFSTISSNQTAGARRKCGEIIGQNGMHFRFVQGGTGPSDHSGFYRKNSAIGFFFTGSHRQYHTEKDTIDLINLDGLLNINRMVNEIILNWAVLEKPLVFTRASQAAVRSDFDFKLRLGIVPGDYSSGNDGLEVYDVRKDAPVSKTGLRKGDLIIKLGTQKISDINDLMEFLSNASSRQKYVLEFRRNGKIHSVQTELMSK